MNMNPQSSKSLELDTEELIKAAIDNNEGIIANNGAFSTTTGERTSRSPNDRFIVKESSTENSIDWGDVNKPFNEDKFNDIKPLLETMGSDVVYCGKSGSGSKMKIINNYMSIVSNIVTAETLSLVEKSGIDLKLAINLLTTTAAGKGHLNVSYPIKVLNNDVSPGFKNTLALKDLRLALEQGSLDGINLNTGKSALNLYEEAEKTKYKDLDWTSMFNFVKEVNNIT